MKIFIIIISAVILLGVVSAQQQNGFVELGSELRLALPQGWTNAGSDELYPFQLVDTESPAELIIFKSVLVPEEAIRSREEFRASVDDVIDSVVLSLPGATLLTTTGLDGDSYAGFVLEFTSIDTASGIMLRHRLSGLLYRDNQNRQFLFTLWGRAGADTYANVANDFDVMQSSVVYLGQTEDDVFGRTGTNEFIYYLMLLAMIAMLFILRRRRKQLIKSSASETISWKCNCGRMNHLNFATCRHCNMPRPKFDN